MNFIKPSNSELERLAILAEEMAESSKIINKIIRFGYENYNPYDALKITNRELLAIELGHVEAMINLLIDNNDIDKETIEKSIDNKIIKVKEWTFYQ